MNDDALNWGCIYKFLSNFYFLLLFPGFWHWSWQCRVCLWTGQGDGGCVGEGGLPMTSCSLPTPATKVPPSLKWKINTKQSKTRKAQPHWMLLLGVWSVLTPALSLVGRKGFPCFFSETTSRASLSTVSRGRERGGMRCLGPPGPFCQHLGTLGLGTHPAAGSLPSESVQTGSTADMPRNASKLWKCL